ncbi:MAG: 30S ribosomal protein S20 [Chloroflexi bacterium]|nr:30S ribosomal protein S20 [Chloroflexota bacterium]|tara:strand:- start:3445 stop:3693 length:249 start_codon:yes stop_codon:yes gene_type:complete
MPPKKTLRSQKNKAVRNRAVKSFTKSRVKNAIDALEDSTPENNQELLNQAFSALDKAASKGVIHKNNASRKKSRLSKKIEAK